MVTDVAERDQGERTVETHLVFWQDPSEVGLERCVMAEGSLGGTALLIVGGAPCEVRYTVSVDQAWRTRHVEVEQAAGAPMVLDVVDGRWQVDGEDRPDLDGCLDVDLEFTPATNTLPIRRLDLAVGEGGDLEVAWLRFPHLRVERARQRYTRLGPDRYEFRMGDFTAELTVDRFGLVRSYGGAWRQVAASSRRSQASACRSRDSS